MMDDDELIETGSIFDGRIEEETRRVLIDMNNNMFDNAFLAYRV